MIYPEAVAALSRREFSSVIAALRGHLAWNPDDGSAWMYLGIAYTETGHHAEALIALAHADVRLEPNPVLDEAFGCAYLRNGQIDRAQSHLEEALRFPDCPPSVYRNLAVLYFRRGQSPTALQLLDQGINANGNDVHMLFLKVMVLEALPHDTSPEPRTTEICDLLDEILGHPNLPPELADAARKRHEIYSR